MTTSGVVALSGGLPWWLLVAIVGAGGLLAAVTAPVGLALPEPDHGPRRGPGFAPGDPVIDNVRRFGVYTLLTSTGSFDTGRAITRPAVLTLRRAARKVRIDTRC